MDGDGKTVISSTMSIMVSLCFFGCKKWEYNVEKNGIHFKKIYHSKGGTNTGFMTENQTIQGFPCEKGWIHFKKDWRLLSFQLSKDFMYNGTLVPVHTWFHFPYHADRSGYIFSFLTIMKCRDMSVEEVGGTKGLIRDFMREVN